MRVIECLTCDPPQELILEEAGVFTFCDSSGEDTSARFFVRCPAKPADEFEDEDVNTQRQDALNTQLTTMFYKLQSEGCQKIHFKNKIPDPFF